MPQDTITISSEQKTIRELADPNVVIRCIQDITSKLEKPVTFGSEQEKANLDCRCGFFRNMNLKMVQDSFEKEDLQFTSVSRDGVPFLVYTVHYTQEKMIGFMLDVKSDQYYQIYMETCGGVVNCYCADLN